LKFYFEQANELVFLAPAILIAGTVVSFVYQSEVQKKLFSTFQLVTLTSLRFITLSILLVLLGGPAIQLYQTISHKPVIILAIDNSTSMKSNQNICEELVNSAKERAKEADFEIWTFGENANKSEVLSFDEERSNYSNLFSAVRNDYLPQSISAVVLAGDGIFNTGEDPVFTSQNCGFPVYTIGIGDTLQQADATILNVKANPTAFIGNEFAVELNLSYTDLAGHESDISIWSNNKELYRDRIKIESGNIFKQQFLRLKAETGGINTFLVRLSSYENEKNTRNNEYEFSIRVIDQKQKILILGNSPHPDIAALSRVITPQKNYDLSVVTDEKSQLNIAVYDLVIVNQMPDSTVANSPLLAKIIDSKRPILWIGSPGISISRLNNLAPGFSYKTPKGTEYATMKMNPSFNLFRIDDSWIEPMENWPPLHVPFSDIAVNENWQSLCYQNIQQVTLSRPLICLGRSNGVKAALIAGEGIWKWRMNDFLENGSSLVFDNLILKLVNFLILKPNEDNFNIFYQPAVTADQPISFNAELLNENDEPINDPDVKLSVIGDKGSTYSYLFDKKNPDYQLNIGRLPVDSYTFEATVEYGNKTLSETGAFSVDKLQLEQNSLKADFNLLYQISENTGGQFTPHENYNKLIDNIISESTLKIQKQKQFIFIRFIDQKWVALLVLILLGLEWFLRKYWGSY